MTLPFSKSPSVLPSTALAATPPNLVEVCEVGLPRERFTGSIERLVGEAVGSIGGKFVGAFVPSSIAVPKTSTSASDKTLNSPGIDISNLFALIEGTFTFVRSPGFGPR